MWEQQLFFGYFFCVHFGDGVNICQGCFKKKKNLLMFLQPVRLKWSHLLRYEVAIRKWHDCNRCFLLFAATVKKVNHNWVSWRKSMFKTKWQTSEKIYHCWEMVKHHNTLNNYGVYWLGWKNKLHESVKTALISPWVCHMVWSDMNQWGTGWQEVIN